MPFRPPLLILSLAVCFALCLVSRATSRFQAARDFESAQLLTSDPSHPDHARIREEILAESAKLKVANAKKKEEHERYFERKRAESVGRANSSIRENSLHLFAC